jgi:cytochrome c oxidase subunit 2
VCRRELLCGLGSGCGTILAGCSGTESAASETAPSTTAAAPDATSTGGAGANGTGGDWRDRASFDDVDREVYVEAERYRFVPGSDRPIRVLRGQRVGIAVTALDNGYHSGHGFTIPAYDVDLWANPGGVSSTALQADETGEFEIRCDVYCGSGHDEMTGTFVVSE